jgi:hypothetical protein
VVQGGLKKTTKNLGKFLGPLGPLFQKKLSLGFI